LLGACSLPQRTTQPRAAFLRAARHAPAAPRRAVRAHIAAPEAPEAPDTAPPPAAPQPVELSELEDPWEDSKWTQYKWTVYRGVAYDLTSFMDRHPAGSWLLNLSLGRDCTALFESYHLRPDVAVARLARLPKLEGFPVDAVPVAPRPNDSALYVTIRERVRREVFRGEVCWTCHFATRSSCLSLLEFSDCTMRQSATSVPIDCICRRAATSCSRLHFLQDAKGAHRSGSEWAALAVLSYAAASWTLYCTAPNVLTGGLLGLAGAWIGLTVQHCGNHGTLRQAALLARGSCLMANCNARASLCCPHWDICP
jgi:acyl-lipid (7-3)-desaturase (Delta-4 desaturase)